MRVRAFITSVVLVAVATAAQAVDLSGKWVGTNQTVVPWCPATTSSTGPAKLEITQDVDAISGTYAWSWKNPNNCVPSPILEEFVLEFSGTVDGTSFQTVVSYSEVEDDGTVTTSVIGTMNGSVDEDGVMNFTFIIPTGPGHDHYPEYLIDTHVTAQLTFAPTPSASVSSLWPPNHKMADIGLIRHTTTTFIVHSDEDDAGEPDAAGSLLLRAERAGTGDGRVYLIAVTTADGLETTCVTVVVPKSQSARDIASVHEQAAAALAQCPSPAGYFVVGN